MTEPREQESTELAARILAAVAEEEERQRASRSARIRAGIAAAKERKAKRCVCGYNLDVMPCPYHGYEKELGQ